MGICYIVGAAPHTIVDFALKDGDFLIAADGGMDAIKQANLHADFWLGDMDSTAEIVEASATCYPSEKDETDLFLALQEGIKRGYTTFVIYGALGGRLDHTMANLQLLLYLAKRGLRGFLVDNTTMVTTICNEQVCINEAQGMISLFAAEKAAEGITLQGLKYTLQNATLTEEFPLGVSNEFLLGETAEITVQNGVLWLVTAKDNLKYWMKSLAKKQQK